MPHKLDFIIGSHGMVRYCQVFPAVGAQIPAELHPSSRGLVFRQVGKSCDGHENGLLIVDLLYDLSGFLVKPERLFRSSLHLKIKDISLRMIWFYSHFRIVRVRDPLNNSQTESSARIFIFMKLYIP